MSVILRLNAFHPDSAACLVIDGQLVGVIAEERLGPREKHSGRLPEHAIRWLLDSNGLKLADVAIARDKRVNLKAKAAHVLTHPGIGVRAVGRFLRRDRQTGASLGNLTAITGKDQGRMRYHIHAVEHHLAHIASAYYLSPFESLTVDFSYDGSGDFASAMVACCEGTRIEVLDRVTLPASLGHFYTAMCQFIGFDFYGEEYKVMGLAPYGEDAHRNLMAEIVRLDPDSWFGLNPRYFDIANGFDQAELNAAGQFRMGRIHAPPLSERLGPPRRLGTEITQREKDITRSTQVCFEEAAMHAMARLRRLVMAGGCALNGVTNARILREGHFQTPYLQSASSDDGTWLGAAYHCWHVAQGCRNASRWGVPSRARNTPDGASCRRSRPRACPIPGCATWTRRSRWWLISSPGARCWVGIRAAVNGGRGRWGTTRSWPIRPSPT